MFHHFRWIWPLASLALASSPSTFAGEPLPGGAHRRLGSTHFRAEGKLTALALSPDRRLLAGSDVNGVVYVWDRRSGRRLHRFDAHTRAAGLAFSPDGKRLAALNRVGEGAVWDLVRGRLLSRLLLEERSGNLRPAQLRFTPDGKQLVFCIDPESKTKPGGYEADYLVYLVDAATGKVVRPLAAGDRAQTFREAALSPDGRRVAVLVEDGEREQVAVRVVEVASGKVLYQIPGPRRTTEQPTARWQRVTFAPDGKSVVLTNGSHFTWLNAADGREIRRLNHESFFVPCLAGFGPAGATLVAYQPTFSGEVAVWDAPSGKVVKSFKVLPECPVVSDGRELLLAHGMVVRRWDLRTGKELPGGQVGHRGAVFGVAFSPDGKVLATSAATAALVVGVADERTWLWDPETGKPLRSLPIQANVLLFSRDGRALLTGCAGTNSDLILWDMETGKKQWAAMSRDPGCFLGASFTANGREILWARRIDAAHGRSQVVVERREAAGGKLLGKRLLPVNSAVWAAFAPDCSVLACDGGWVLDESGGGSRGHEQAALMRLWDTRTCGLRWSRSWANPDGVVVARFTPDGRRLLLASWDGWLSLYEAATGQPAWRVGLYGRHVTAAAVSRDGRLLVTGDVRNRFATKEKWVRAARRGGFAAGKEVKGATALRLWPLPGGRCPIVLDWDGPQVCSLALSAAGGRLACGLSDGTILVWDVRHLLGRNSSAK